MSEPNYSISKPLTFKIVRTDSKEFTWEVHRQGKVITKCTEAFNTAVTARRSVDRFIDNIRRNVKAPRIEEAI